MQRYLLRRFVLILPTLIGVTLFVFAMIRFLPGDAVSLMLEDYRGYAKDLEDLRAKLGLTLPFHEQYFNWVAQIARGDLGNSLRDQSPVIEEIQRRIPITVELGLLGLIISILISIPLGVYSAVRQDTLSDYIARSTATGFLAIPGFWLATLSITLPSIWWKWTPPLRYTQFADDPAKNLAQMILPALILGIGLSGALMRLTRTQMLEVLRQDYIRTAWAKGFAERVVIFRHALKNAFIPVATLLGLQVSVLISGTVVLESIFVIPGMGRFLLDAINSRDYPQVQAVVFIFALLIIFSNLIVDILYAWLDPRIRYS
ncbi:MAG: ABC transporter permease [Chloroflexi bacterium]|nr:ABC transporter permease [Chloroflexota bacterium]MBI3742343.1 ABC transporter permease [Chloroflexota bacterium]